MSEDFEVKNSDGDFAQIQNYVIQLAAEGKIHNSAFLLYAFYRSVAGFSKINFSYEYISLNTGISKGAITSGNKELVKNGLIIVKNNGKNKCHTINIITGSSLPRRQLKKIDREDLTNDLTVQNTDGAKNEQHIQKLNTKQPRCSINDPDKNSTIKNNYRKTSPSSGMLYYGRWARGFRSLDSTRL